MPFNVEKKNYYKLKTDEERKQNYITSKHNMYLWREKNRDKYISICSKHNELTKELKRFRNILIN